MAQTPTDPTKAQVWITKGIDDLDFEFYIPSGPKGDPGGITLGTMLSGTSNLNEYKTSGVYRLGTTYSGLLLLNFPRDTDSGILVVYERVVNQTLVQEWHSMQVQGRGFYIRHMTNTDVWSSWRFVTTSRVDQTAGRAIYQWDDINNRDQLVWGDTGARVITTDYLDTTKWSAGTIKLRRFGAQVELRFLGMTPASGISGSVNLMTQVLPLGFQQQHSFSCVMGDNLNNLIGGNFSFGGGPITMSNVVNGRSYSGLFTFQTTNTWPTTLPGTADNTIGNT